MRTAVFFLLFLTFSLLLQAQAPLRQGGGSIEPAVPADGLLFSETGDAAIARRYVEWALKEMADSRNTSALAVLEKGSDYADVSSDISYLMAVLRSLTGKPRFSRLEACRKALATRRWEKYTPEDALLLQASTLTELRRFEEALQVLQRCSPSRYETQYARLCAFSGLENAELRYIAAMRLIMDSFPRKTAPVRLLFESAEWLSMEARDNLRPLVDLALKRLPALISDDPELAFLAAPFIRDKEEARRYVGSYRAETPHVNAASLPAALNLGLVDGKKAVDELFAPLEAPKGVPKGAGTLSFPAQYKPAGSPLALEKRLIVTINSLLRSEDERAYLRRILLQFSGVIIESGGGIVEEWTVYRNGMIQEYGYDSDWDGESELVVAFAQGLPSMAEVTLGEDKNSSSVVPLNNAQKRKALLRWERYPAALDARLEGKRFILRPLEFMFTPFRFTPLVYGGPDYPRRELSLPVLTEKSLLSFSNVLEQPSDVFKGGTERVELLDGIPVKSAVYAEGKKVSEKTYRLGLPLIEYLDMDMDGRMETIRRYDSGRLVLTESDWDGDGIYEYAEIPQPDGSVKKIWDFDLDGVRETTHE